MPKDIYSKDTEHYEIADKIWMQIFWVLLWNMAIKTWLTEHYLL